MYENFIRAIEAKGITPPAEIIADGEIHRFDSDHSGKSNGAYVLHSDEPQSGWFKCWKTGTENNWSRGYSETDPVKKEQFQKLIKQRTQERTVKILELQKNAAIKASTEYQDAKPADPDHPYLKRKQIKPVKGLKQDPTTGDLIVPIYCKNGNIISRQTINKEGDKYFLKDGQTKGGYFDFGETTENIVICEGFATGASIFEATGYRVRLAFNCGNLKEVAITSKEEYPKAHIIIAGDDDHKTEGNPGRIKAIEAASSIDTSVVFPDFGENRPEKVTDFNDLHCLKGLDAVRKCFETIPEPLIISLADTGLAERQKKHLKEGWEKPEKDRFPDEPEETLNESLKQSLEGSDTLKNLFADWNPTLQTAIKKIADGHNVTFETALSAFIGMTSIAIGGNKTIRSERWTEKAILWIAFHAPTGKGKSPLFRDCGRIILEAKNNELSSKYEEQKREFKKWKSEAKESRGEQPEVIRKLIWTTYTNLEALTQAHLENPTGIALVHDELDALISGRNQYKGGKGDDTAKLLEFWNGHGINNLTINDYRNIPSVFVPIIGGIQTDLLTKIFNPEDLANGFVSRFLLCPFRHPCPPIIDSERKKIRADISYIEWQSVKNIIEKLLYRREEEIEFTFELEAEDILYQHHDALTVEISKNVQEMESSFQKLKTYSLRLSLLLHFIKGETVKVTPETVLDAIELINWFSENMKAAFYSTYASSRDKNLKKILERLRQSPHPLGVKDLYSAFRKSFDGYDQIKEILNKLLRTGLIEEIEGSTVKYFAKPFL